MSGHHGGHGHGMWTDEVMENRLARSVCKKLEVILQWLQVLYVFGFGFIVCCLGSRVWIFWFKVLAETLRKSVIC